MAWMAAKTKEVMARRGCHLKGKNFMPWRTEKPIEAVKRKEVRVRSPDQKTTVRPKISVIAICLTNINDLIY